MKKLFVPFVYIIYTLAAQTFAQAAEPSTKSTNAPALSAPAKMSMWLAPTADLGSFDEKTNAVLYVVNNIQEVCGLKFVTSHPPLRSNHPIILEFPRVKEVLLRLYEEPYVIEDGKGRKDRIPGVKLMTVQVTVSTQSTEASGARVTNTQFGEVLIGAFVSDTKVIVVPRTAEMIESRVVAPKATAPSSK